MVALKFRVRYSHRITLYEIHKLCGISAEVLFNNKVKIKIINSLSQNFIMQIYKMLHFVQK